MKFTDGRFTWEVADCECIGLGIPHGTWYSLRRAVKLFGEAVARKLYPRLTTNLEISGLHFRKLDPFTVWTSRGWQSMPVPHDNIRAPHIKYVRNSK